MTDPGTLAKRRLVGQLLAGAGVIVTFLCGLCTIASGLGMLSSSSSDGIGMVLVVGGIPTAVGVLMLVAAGELLSSVKEAERARDAASRLDLSD